MLILTSSSSSMAMDLQRLLSKGPEPCTSGVQAVEKCGSSVFSGNLRRNGCKMLSSHTCNPFKLKYLVSYLTLCLF